MDRIILSRHAEERASTPLTDSRYPGITIEPVIAQKIPDNSLAHWPTPIYSACKRTLDVLLSLFF